MSVVNRMLGVGCVLVCGAFAAECTEPLFSSYRNAGLEWQSAASSSQRSGKQSSGDDSSAGARLSHGKKLMLKDGNFQLVREYERKGERVRYFSLERGAWEEIPAAMVD